MTKNSYNMYQVLAEKGQLENAIIYLEKAAYFTKSKSDSVIYLSELAIHYNKLGDEESFY